MPKKNKISLFAGDVVYLKSGSPAMTIESSKLTGSTEILTCVWWSEQENKFLRETFFPEMLTKADDSTE